MAIDPGRTEPRSRRAILAGAIGGLAGLVGSRFASPDRTSAAAGGPVIMGAANSAGVTNTSLTTTSSGTALLVTQSGTGTALRGSAVGAGSIAGFFTANNGTGISGVTGTGGSYGVFAQNNGAAGTAGALRAFGGQNHGVVATTANGGKYAVYATGANGAPAIYGTAIQGGVRGDGYRGVMGYTASNGASAGVWGRADTSGADAWGVLGESNTAGGGAIGVYGTTSATTGNGIGVKGNSDSTDSSGVGVYGTRGGTGLGVSAQCTDGSALYGISTSWYGLWVDGGTAGAANLNGNVAVNGTLSKTAGSFKIDHPVDPANKWLYHSFVESPDMKNVYDGVATLDSAGEATVSLPSYFDALNRDVRYQLTAIGKAAPDLHVKSEAKNNQFSIAGGTAGLKVSWQVTGIRQDAYAKAHPIVAEVAKTGVEKGHYQNPTEHGVAKSKGIKLSATGSKA
jgi:hypothetical protein